jgi:hypothetical protein
MRIVKPLNVRLRMTSSYSFCIDPNPKIHKPAGNYSPFFAGDVLYRIISSVECNAEQFVLIAAPGVHETLTVIIGDIMAATDLDLLSREYDDYFLMPMRTKRVYDDVYDSSGAFEAKVRERYNKKSITREGFRCALTGWTMIDVAGEPKGTLQVTQFIPQCLLNGERDRASLKQTKLNVRNYITRLCPWLPSDFF